VFWDPNLTPDNVSFDVYEPFYESEVSLADFVLGPGRLKRETEFLQSIENVRSGREDGLAQLVRSLNESTRDVPRYRLQAGQIIMEHLGSPALELQHVLTLKGRHRFEWQSLKRCQGCGKFFYGGGKRKTYCEKNCERRRNNQYKPERDRIRSAHYRFCARLVRNGKKEISLDQFKRHHYKPRAKRSANAV